ncbi:MAG: ribosome assembly RNA-binding protein YhbY [Clostridia bacterium]|nr:ribosome assembly RNA-binding protein YhbY [Clostridia bacterium]
MTGKERAAFRAQANGLEPLFQVGKGGMSDALIKQTDDALKARELIKVKVLLESSPITPRETADELAKATGAEVIQVIGGVIVLYRESPELKEKALQKEKNKKMAAKKAKEKLYAAKKEGKKVYFRSQTKGRK